MVGRYMLPWRENNYFILGQDVTIFKCSVIIDEIILTKIFIYKIKIVKHLFTCCPKDFGPGLGFPTNHPVSHQPVPISEHFLLLHFRSLFTPPPPPELPLPTFNHCNVQGGGGFFKKIRGWLFFMKIGRGES